MPTTITLTSKYVEDASGNKFAPITTPNAVRFSDGDTLNDKLIQSDWNQSSSSAIDYIKNKPSSLPANGGNAATVNSHTVLSDVPANAVFTDTTYTTMGASGSGHKGGLVPDPGSTAGTTKFLREDGTWQIPESGGSVIPVVLLYEPNTPELGMVMFDSGVTDKFYQYQTNYNNNTNSWVEIATPHKAIGVDSNYDWYEIIDGVVSQTALDTRPLGWSIYYIGTTLFAGIGQVIYMEEYGGGILPTWDDIANWNNKQDAITFNSTYNATTNPAATMADMPDVGLPVGSGTATSLASLPVTNRMIVATISTNLSKVSIANGVSALTAGCELHVVVKATAAVTITLPTSSPYVNMNADTTLSLAANSYAEINFISDGTNIYVRSIA